MLKQLFGTRPTTKADVYLAAGAAVIAVVKFFDTRHQYKQEQLEKESDA